ncbi:P-type ATPase [Thioploca ingrica]|uniref:P-type ATPase n=1 Tax=Thioploca ingrica TaxID=40754 RepID=A0A090BVB0_9GAMM|nr:P-type ATPase [Thioploca ingrica]
MLIGFVPLFIGGATGYWLVKKFVKTPSRQPARPLSITQLLKDLKGAMVADERQQLQVDIDPRVLESIENARKKSSQRLKLTVGATGLALLGSVYPAFYVLGTVSVLYLSRHIFIRLQKDFKLKHYLSTNSVGLVLTVDMLASGHLVLAAFAGAMGSFFVKIIDRVEGNAQQQLITTFMEHPEFVWVLKDGVEIQLNCNDVQINDIVIVHAGEVIPVDGTIQSGVASIDQHILTGESQPIEKSVGDQVFASTLLLSGRINILVKTTGKAVVAAKIGQVLQYTQSYKDTLITRGREISDRFIPVTVGASIITLPLLGHNSATAVLWSAPGTTMGLLGPVSVLIYSQILARQGILIKDGRTLESLRQVNTIVFDKTGTLTLEQPTVAKIHSFEDYSSSTVLKYAATAEYRQAHPLAKAILAKAEEEHLELSELTEASYQVGYGIKVTVDEQLIRVGSSRFLQSEGIKFPESIGSIQQQAESDNASLIYVSLDQQLAGILEIQPTIRPEAKSVIQYLKQRGFKLVIISGDHKEPTRRMAETLDIEHYFAETLPENKATLVKEMRKKGDFVCFIGDGINDAIALKSAQLSISLKGASTVATDTAQIIFMDGTLTQLEDLFRFTDEFEDTMKRNLTTSIVPSVISIGGIYFLHFGIATAMGLTYLGGLAGLGNLLLPLVKHTKQKSNH